MENESAGGSLRIEEVEVRDSRILIFRFSASSNVRRYLHSDCFYVKYDEPIQDVPVSMLSIPGVAGLITLCWVTNSDLYVDELDSRYLESMEAVRGVLNRFYPGIGFQGEVICEERVDNSFGNRGLGLLFSGGVDSTALYIKHRRVKPTLFTIIGGVIPPRNRGFTDRFKRTYREFADSEGVRIHFIETNIRRVLNESLLWSENRVHLERPWWEMVNMGIIYLGLVSPVTTRGIGRLLIASSGSYRSRKPYGSHPLLDNSIGWGDVEVFHDLREYNREEKITHLIKRLVEEGNAPALQVCNYTPRISDGLNCSTCGDCACTIAGLLAANIDPTRCGFQIRRDIYTKTKEYVKRSTLIKVWRNIQKEIDLECNDFHQNSEDFLRWLKKADLEAINKPPEGIDLERILLPLQAKLPRVVQDKILETYYSWRYGE
ncbi:MAG: hypothetical protein ACLFVP_04490 [Candidatus Bathyarchaeia archaeon]